MNSVNQKYNGCGTHRRAILHMIGQAESVFKSEPTVREIAAWMNVSKVTARKYLDILEKNGEVIKTVKRWRGNANVHTYRLHDEIAGHYKAGMLSNDYYVYASRVLGVIAL